MTSLFAHGDAEPAVLPFSAYSQDGRIWTDLADNPDGLKACGFVAAPAQPAFDASTQTLVWSGGAWVVTSLPLDTLKANALAAAQAQFASRIAAGAPYQGKTVQLDDGSQARLTAIGTTALAVAGGAVPWPDGYAKGWITPDGTRIPLPQASDGLTLAATVGGYYATLVQHEQDLENAINAATDAAGVAAVDVTAGWPS